jgi:death on curing protein
LLLTVDDIVQIHYEIEEQQQFKPHEKGVRSWSALEWIAERPSTNVFHYEPYPDIYSKCACLIEGIIRFHPFNNGNKRTALAAAYYYMYKNGYNMIIPFQAVKFSVIIAASDRINVECIAKWIRQHSCSSDKTAIEEYYSKFKEYYIKPAKMIADLYESGQYQKINRILLDWFRYDIHPDYLTRFPKYMADVPKIASLLIDMIERPPPPPPPPPSHSFG